MKKCLHNVRVEWKCWDCMHDVRRNVPLVFERPEWIPAHIPFDTNPGDTRTPEEM